MRYSIRALAALLLLSLLLVALAPVAQASTAERADNLFNRALAAEQKMYCQQALDLYQAALVDYERTGNTSRIRECREKICKMLAVLSDYSLTEAEARKALDDTFIGFTADEKAMLLETLKGERMVIDGKTRYFSSFCSNIIYRNPELLRRIPGMREGLMDFSAKYREIILRDLDRAYVLKPWNSYINPMDYSVRLTLDIPRKKLPAKGIFRLWVPTPIQLDAQRNVRFTSIEPQAFLKRAPATEADLGNVYFEIPLESLKEDLHVSVAYLFTRYEQFFNIDPANVGNYDQDSDLYQRYTRSDRNVTVNAEIQQKAREVVGEETNPYLQAKMLYYYVLNNYRYSYMPHLYLDQWDIPESVYVFEHGYGDCGAQSALFAALCRSIGIPARDIGGKLLTPGSPSDHFWAEFYLPTYGWVPVDTTVDEAVLMDYDLTPEVREKINEYFFGHLDNRRHTIQRDLDIPLSPREQLRSTFHIAVQDPRAECIGMNPIELMEMVLSNSHMELDTAY